MLHITRFTQIVIYGAGEVGQNFAKRARHAGFNVVSFLDRQVVGDICGLPVKRPSEPPIPSESLVIICLANGMQHRQVARELNEVGYKYIAFLPICLPILPQLRDDLTRTYNRLLSLKSLNDLVVEDFNQLMTLTFDPESAIIASDDDKVTVLIEAELLFSEDYKTWEGDKTKLTQHPRYFDVNIAAYDFYLSLFRYFSGAEDSWLNYAAGFTQNSSNVHIDIGARCRLYEQFCCELDRGLNFFVEAAADARWSSRGYFNLVGGHHRTCFLFFRKHRLLPIKISKDDFATWANTPSLANVAKFFHGVDSLPLYAPVPHPAFRHLAARRETHLDSLYSTLTAWCGTDEMTGQTVIDLCDDEGYFARLLYRLKAGAVTTYAPNAAKARLTMALNELLYMPQIHVAVGDPATNDSCSFLVVMDRATGIAADERFALIKQANALCTDKMLWESYAEDFEADCQAIYTQSKFKHCEILMHAVLDGRRRTAAIFSK